jgi:predicted RNA-binding Zn-ribbon protein involved in translation (DUF1610 family)
MIYKEQADQVYIGQKRGDMKHLFAVIVFIVAGVCFSGCSQKELNDLRLENKNIKADNQQLKTQIAELKETADYYYQEGVHQVSVEDYGAAGDDFKAVISRFPTSPLVVHAKQQLAKVASELAKIEAQNKADEKRLEAQHRAEEYRKEEARKNMPPPGAFRGLNAVCPSCGTQNEWTFCNNCRSKNNFVLGNPNMDTDGHFDYMNIECGVCHKGLQYSLISTREQNFPCKKCGVELKQLVRRFR